MKFLLARPSCRNIVMAVAPTRKSRYVIGGMSVNVGLVLCSATCIQLFLPAILI